MNLQLLSFLQPPLTHVGRRQVVHAFERVWMVHPQNLLPRLRHLNSQFLRFLQISVLIIYQPEATILVIVVNFSHSCFCSELGVGLDMRNEPSTEGIIFT